MAIAALESNVNKWAVIVTEGTSRVAYGPFDEWLKAWDWMRAVFNGVPVNSEIVPQYGPEQRRGKLDEPPLRPWRPE